MIFRITHPVGRPAGIRSVTTWRLLIGTKFDVTAGEADSSNIGKRRGHRLCVFPDTWETMATIGSLRRISAASLAKLVLAEQQAGSNASPSSMAIIDVRDDGEKKPTTLRAQVIDMTVLVQIT
jgi:hypothetical protein